MRGNFGTKTCKTARNCLAYMLNFTVMQMSKGNREKGYSSDTENIWCLFGVKPLFSNSTGVDCASVTVSCVIMSTSRYTEPALQSFVYCALPSTTEGILCTNRIQGENCRAVWNYFVRRVILFRLFRALRVWVSKTEHRVVILVVCGAYV